MELLKYMIVVHVHWDLVNSQQYTGSTVCCSTHNVQNLMCYKQCGLFDHNVVSENVNIIILCVFVYLPHLS